MMISERRILKSALKRQRKRKEERKTKEEKERERECESEREEKTIGVYKESLIKGIPGEKSYLDKII